jgi:hypothetical protein
VSASLGEGVIVVLIVCSRGSTRDLGWYRLWSPRSRHLQSCFLVGRSRISHLSDNSYRHCHPSPLHRNRSSESIPTQGMAFAPHPAWPGHDDSLVRGRHMGSSSANFLRFMCGLLIWAFIPGLTFLESLVIGSCVTPTDPVLANSICKGESV